MGYLFWLLDDYCLGLCQYDPDGLKAKALEEAIEGVHVIRHGKYNHLFCDSCTILVDYRLHSCAKSCGVIRQNQLQCVGEEGEN